MSSPPAALAAIQSCTDAAARAWTLLNPLATHRAISDATRAEAIERLAAALALRRQDILETCANETALLLPELAPEFDRMIGTLGLFAAVAREGAWREAADDPSPVPPSVAIGPPHPLRVSRIPLGPVAVFGASNFPLAYGVCGGDTASALAVGCPVIVKEHPAHPATGRLIAAIAREAFAALPGPLAAGMFSYAQLPDPIDPADNTLGSSLVSHPVVKGVGFTGSLRGGMALDAIARGSARPGPIPVFAEMGSINPVFVTPGAITARGSAIADEIASSLLLRFGQQCTCPGVVFLPAGVDAQQFIARISSRIAAAPGRDMLATWIANAYASRLDALARVPGVDVLATGGETENRIRGGRAAILRANPDAWSSHHTLREEVFGPALVVITLEEWRHAAALPIPGTLTLSIYFEASDAADAALARDLVAVHGHSAGRIIASGVPTGVRACESMVHGGPYPATNCPDSTAVGPRAARRWTRPVCWQGLWP